MTIDEITDLVLEMAALKYFPAEPSARVAIVRMIGEMAHSDDQIRWLIRRMTSGIYAEWPGLQELRACFCSRFKPKDGINVYSTVYPDGLPPDPTAPRRGIEGPEMLALPEGSVSADPLIDKAVGIAIAINAGKCSDKFSAPVTAAEIAAAPKWLRRLEGYEK